MTTPDHVRQNGKAVEAGDFFIFWGNRIDRSCHYFFFTDSFVRDFQIKNLGSTRPPKGRKSRACRRAALHLLTLENCEEKARWRGFKSDFNTEMSNGGR